MGGIGEAHGKLLLFGEHAAVYGYLAVGIALPETLTVRLEDSESPGWDLQGVAAEDRQAVTRLIERLEPLVPGSRFRRRRSVHIESTVPRGVGFGSSAALCGAFARALLQNCGSAASERAWALAHEAEHLFHGSPSGVDTGLAMHDGTSILKPRRGKLPGRVRVPRVGVSIVTGAVRRDAACAALIAGLASRMQRGDRAVKSAIDELGALAVYAGRVVHHGRRNAAEYLGSLANAAMKQLRSLGLSTPDLEVVLEAARGAGALGAKLSGAGGGGAFYAVAPDERTAAVIALRISEAAGSAGITLLSAPRAVTA